MYENLATIDLETALYAGYIDGTAAAKEQYMPKLLTNDAKTQTKVLTSIISELESCDEFLFSVAFVTNSGVECLIDTLIKLKNKGIKGKILASQYQNFTEPRALKRLIGFDNIEVRIQTENNFHAKGYLFRHGTGHTLIIGSSNLTQNALCENNEWNLRVSSFEKGSIVSDIRGEFDRQFEDATIVDDEYIRVYSEIYKYQRIAQITVSELVDFGIYRNSKDYSGHYGSTPLVLYAKYTYEDVCRLLDWEKGEVPLNIGGYKYDKKTKTYPVFINYDKEEDIADTIKYNDHFESSSRLIAISKSNRSVESEDVQTALRADELGVAMHLFVRKNKDDRISKEFYYLGRMHATGKTEEFIMPGTSSNAVEIEYVLDEPIPDALYSYIIS